MAAQGAKQNLKIKVKSPFLNKLKSLLIYRYFLNYYNLFIFYYNIINYQTPSLNE